MNDYYLNLSIGAGWWLYVKNINLLHHDVRDALFHLFETNLPRWNHLTPMCVWVLNNLRMYGHPLGNVSKVSL